MSKNPLRSSDQGEIASLTEVFSRHRKFLGILVAFGDIALAVGAVIGLWNYADHGRLLAWGALIIIFMWEIITHQFPANTADDRKLRNRWGWMSTII